MTFRSSTVVGTGLVIAALMAAFLIFHEKSSKHDNGLIPHRTVDPWADSPWAVSSPPFASAISIPSSGKVGPTPRKPQLSESVAPFIDSSRLAQGTPTGEKENVAGDEPDGGALNVKWPPLVSVPSNAALRKPRGWALISTAYAAANCRFSADDSYVHTGRYSALLRYDGADPKLRCFFGQVSKAGAFGGNRVQLSAFIAGRDVVGGAGLIFRADDADGNVVAYNFDGRATFRGSQPWGYDVVIVDVPDSAAKIYYGAWLGPGGGSLWVDTMEFHIVDDSFPVTHPPPAQSRKSGAPAFQPPPVPTNLDFEDTDPILN